MSDFFDRMEKLSPEKRELLDLFLRKEQVSAADIADYVAPRDDKEGLLAEIWSEILGVESVGVHDNYFALGGDSILIVHILSKARRRGLEIQTYQFFDYPTIAQLAEISEWQSAAQAEDAGLEPFAAATLDEAGLAQVRDRFPNMVDAFPLTSMQEGILYHALLDPGSGSYLVQWSALIEGTFDCERFKEIWQDVMARQPMLRIAIAWQGVSPAHQVVVDSVEPLVEVLDWRHLSESDASEKLADLEKQDRLTDFDLNKPPLVRTILVRLSDTRTHCLWTHHHILLDGWSQFHILAEVLAGFGGQEPSKERSKSFAHYVAWQRGQTSAEATGFWKAYLTGYEGRPRRVELAPEEPIVFDRHPWTVPQELHDGLKTLAQSHQLTLNVLIQGIYALTLSQETGERDVVFGVTHSGRNAPLAGIDEMVGPFINTVPLRIAVDGDAGFIDWLSQLHRDQQTWRTHEHTPLTDIQRAVSLAPDTDLFDALLVFENLPTQSALVDPEGRFAVKDLSVAAREGYPLALVVLPGESLLLEFKYEVPPYNEEKAVAYQTMVETMMRAVQTDPAVSLSELMNQASQAADETARAYREKRQANAFAGLKRFRKN